MSVKDRNEYHREWARKNSERRKEINKKYRDANRELTKSRRRVKLYSLTDEEFAVLKQQQNNCCAICGNPPTETSNYRDELDIDHCHKTGKVRGLLCNNCNRGLGHFKDDLALLESAIAYLNITNQGNND